MIFAASTVILSVFDGWLFAAASSDPANSILDFAKYGILGLVLLAIVGGWLWAKPSVDQLKADKALAESRADKMQETVELAVPALAEAARVFKDVLPRMEEYRKQSERVEAVMRDVQVRLAAGGHA